MTGLLSRMQLGVLFALLLVACTSTPQRSEDLTSVAYDLPTCTCGTLLADSIGCAYAACLRGEGDPQNAECYCASFNGAEPVDGEASPRAQYALRNGRAATDDFAEQMSLGNEARELTLFFNAKKHYQHAVRADPARAVEVLRAVFILRRQVSEAELNRAREAIEAGEVQATRQHLMRVVQLFSYEPAASVARGLLTGQFDHERGLEAEAFMALDGQLQRTLQPAQRHLERARDHVRKGLAGSRSRLQSLHSYDEALSSVRHAYELLDRTDARASNSQALTAALERMKLEVARVGIEATIEQAKINLPRGKRSEAIAQANAVLAVEPDHAIAREIRQRAEDDSEDGWGWYLIGEAGWVWSLLPTAFED